VKYVRRVRGYRRFEREGEGHEAEVLAEVEITVNQDVLAEELGQNAIRNSDRTSQGVRGAVKARVLRDLAIDGEPAGNE